VLIQRDVGVGRELGDECWVLGWRNAGRRARRSARGGALMKTLMYIAIKRNESGDGSWL